MAKANHFVATLNINNFHYSVRKFHCFTAREGFRMCKLFGKSATLDPDSVNDLDPVQSKPKQTYIIIYFQTECFLLKIMCARPRKEVWSSY
jgi:hypothetical protein